MLVILCFHDLRSRHILCTHVRSFIQTHQLNNTHGQLMVNPAKERRLKAQSSIGTRCTDNYDTAPRYFGLNQTPLVNMSILNSDKQRRATAVSYDRRVRVVAADKSRMPPRTVLLFPGGTSTFCAWVLKGAAARVDFRPFTACLFAFFFSDVGR